MVVYVVTGASRGLGYEFLCQLSGADNVVFGLVRNAPPTEAKVKADNLQNVHILQADIIDLPSLQAARSEIQKITPVVDVLINNAAYLSEKTAFSSLSDFENNPDLLEEELKLNFDTNVIGVIKTINTFLPMVEQSKIKKVISISSGLADDNLTNGFEGFEAAPYSISKAGLNTAVAKYNARHKKDGILFLSISPGVVDTGNSGQRESPYFPGFDAKY